MSIRLVILALGVALLFPAGAAADLRVPAGDSIDEIRAVGENVRVDGTTTGSVIVIDGDLVIGPSGRAGGAVVIGGRIDVRRGGRLEGKVFHLAGAWPELALWQAMLALLGLLLMRVLVVMLVVRIAAVLAGRPVAGALAGAGRTRPLRTLVVGGLGAFGIFAAAVVSALTVVGLAVSAALIGILIAATVVGVALSLRSVGATAAHRRLATLTLATPVIGDAASALAAVVGVGVALRYFADHAEEAPGVPEVRLWRPSG